MSTELFVKVHSIHIIINPQQSKLLKNVKLKVTMATTKLFFHCLEQLWNNKNSSWYLTCKIVNNYVRISRIFRNPALDVAVSTNWHALITGFWFFFFFFFWCGPFLKFLLNVLQYCICFVLFFFGHKACGILVAQPRIKPAHPAVEGEVGLPGKPHGFWFLFTYLEFAMRLWTNLLIFLNFSFIIDKMREYA